MTRAGAATKPNDSSPAKAAPKPNIPARAKQPAKPTGVPPAQYGNLIAACEAWEDINKTKTAQTNRLGAIERAGAIPPKDLLVMVVGLDDAQRACERLIRKEVRQHPLASIAEDIKGLGEHSFGYLLAKLNGSFRIAYPKYWVENGDGRWAHDTQGPGAVPKRELYAAEPYERTVSQLWSYCGVGDPERKHRPGMTQDEALACGLRRSIRPRLFLIAESFIKARNEHYRAIYDAAKAHVADRGWTPGHMDAHAKRIIAKTFLKDAWIAEGQL